MSIPGTLSVDTLTLIGTSLAMILPLATLGAAGCKPSRQQPTPEYRQEVETFRQKREARMRSDTGWLTVAGLFFLKEGRQTFGSAPDSDIVLPASAPAHAGSFTLAGGQVSVEAAAGVPLTLANGQAVTQMNLRSDQKGEPDMLHLGRLRLFVIERTGRLAIRMRDLDSPQRTAFKGLRWFDIDPAYKVVARYDAYPTPRKLAVPSILGVAEMMDNPGTVTFQLGGHEHTLEAVVEENELFLIFRDLTTGKETYGAGRFLYAPLPKDGKVVLDFNQAFTPPCAFTRFATCPLPPAKNVINIRLEAGELDAHH
jgi:uncharacterized protein (DUF1684 family)